VTLLACWTSGREQPRTRHRIHAYRAEGRPSAKRKQQHAVRFNLVGCVVVGRARRSVGNATHLLSRARAGAASITYSPLPYLDCRDRSPPRRHATAAHSNTSVPCAFTALYRHTLLPAAQKKKRLPCCKNLLERRCGRDCVYPAWVDGRGQMGVRRAGVPTAFVHTTYASPRATRVALRHAHSQRSRHYPVQTCPSALDTSTSYPASPPRAPGFRYDADECISTFLCLPASAHLSL